MTDPLSPADSMNDHEKAVYYAERGRLDEAEALDTQAIRDRVAENDWRLKESFTCRAAIFDLCDEVDALREALSRD